MERFEITIDGVVHPNDFATQVEANNAAAELTKKNAGRTVAVRPKAAPVPDTSKQPQPPR